MKFHEFRRGLAPVHSGEITVSKEWWGQQQTVLRRLS